MSRMRIVELRDIDGDYIVGKILGPRKLRVLESSIVPEGTVLFSDGEMTWKEAACTFRGITELAPRDLLDSTRRLSEEWEVEDPLVQELLSLTDEDESFLKAARPLESLPGNCAGDPADENEMEWAEDLRIVFRRFGGEKRRRRG